ncbi:MAG: carbohydrate kinase [Actinobacteria bacterium]|nr:carbohydrate kinase [Actinomycetota bacterium]
MGYLLGYDAGSSSIKAVLLDADTGKAVATASSPREEMAIMAPRPGWAEQDPDTWWDHLVRATAMLRRESGVDPRQVLAIGISYQMHGLVVVGRDLKPLRPSIIWCDSRAVGIGERAFAELGAELCLSRILNSPGNFTASRLAWVKDNEPEIYRGIRKFMLPGDYLALRMTGLAATTPSGLSEMILWDFERGEPALMLLEHYGIDPELLPELCPTFGVQGELTRAAAEELGLEPGTPVAYRAGDQPNNAFALKVLEPGEAAATAGTSGVVYGVNSAPRSDPRSRVNAFVHVNHRAETPRYGMLMCVNGTGILYRWLRDNLGGGTGDTGYGDMNELAASAEPGSRGLMVMPYGNGAERTLENRNPGASLHNLDFNLHTRAHLLRAAQEGIVFALNYGLDIMRGVGVEAKTARAGKANMFLSPLFGEIFATVTGATLEIYDTDGAQGAARGAGLGAGIYGDPDDAFRGLRREATVAPDPTLENVYGEAYGCWKKLLESILESS